MIKNLVKGSNYTNNMDNTICDMDFKNISKTLRIVVIQIKDDIRIWHKIHTIGYATLMHMLDVHINMIALKEQANRKTATSRQVNYAKEKIRKLSCDLVKPYELLGKRLLEIAEANRRIRRMLGQVNVWLEEPALREFTFARNFKLKQMQHFLEFLIARLEAEYEIKDMVVANLFLVKTKLDVDTLLLSWQSTRHALTPEFNEIVAEFEFNTLGLMYYI